MSNRTVATDALATLGTIIDDTQKRDAIHLAVEPVIANCTLRPGGLITVREGVAYPAGDDDALGIVDPFLAVPVRKGQRFWFIMMPRMVTSLRHVWAHPAFPDEAGTPAPAVESAKSASEKWMRDLAEDVGFSYGRLMDGAADWVRSKRDGDEWGQYLIGGAEMEGTSTPLEFWAHYEILTGDRVEEEHRGSFFSCSC